MKPLSLIAALVATLFMSPSLAQVDDIKGKSLGGLGGGESSVSGGGFATAIVLDLAIESVDLFVYWQQETLKKKETIPHIVSVEVLLQTALQPSTYYIVHPRIRANWGSSRLISG